jgi:hypothetical protein
MSAPEVLPKVDKDPVLIVDRQGQLGVSLAAKLKNDATLVFVSETPVKDVIHIPFEKRFPQIPDNNYSHIFVIDDGSNITRESLASFLEKSQNDNSVFLFIAHMREINEKLISDITSYYKKAKILFYGDIFGPGPIDKNADVIKYIAQARIKNKILVPGDGTNVTYPVFASDLIDGILEAVFSQEENQVFYCFPKHPPTLISLARMIQKTNPHVLLDFTSEEKNKAIKIPEDGKYLLDENYPLESKIKTITIEEKIYEDSEEEKEVTEDKIKIKIPKWWILLVLVLLILPFLSAFALTILGGISLKGAELYIDRGDLSKAQKSASFGRTYFELAEKTLNLVPVIGRNLSLKDRNKTVGISFILDGLVYRDIAEFKKGLIEIQKEKTSYPLAKLANATIGGWEELLGFKEKRKYLLLLQDKRELRSTGGIIDSFAMLSLDKGNASVSKIIDANIPDAKAKGQIEPPFPIRRFLKSQNLLFKDTGFNIDFISSASSAATLFSVLEKEKVDGVIAFDKSLYEEIQTKWEKGHSRLETLRKLESAIDNKQILFAFNDQNLQNIFTANNWSSSLWDARANGEEVINDFFGINEANLSKNKNSQLLKRKVTYDTKLAEDGKFTSVATLNYTNEAGETYKNYIRIITPLGAEIKEVRVNDKLVETKSAVKNPRVYEARNFRPGDELEIDEYTQSGKTVFGFYFEIGGKAVEEIKLTYESPEKIKLDSQVTYNLKVFKQPYNDLSFEFSIYHPVDFKITSGSKDKKHELIKDETILAELSKI